MDRKRTREEKDHLDKIVGGNIKAERLLRGLSRDELAKKLDLTVSHLGLIERGERGATLVTIDRLVRDFGINLQSLFLSKEARAGAGTKSSGKNGKKVETLILSLSEQELGFLLHSIKGLIKLRTEGNDAE